MTRLRRRSTMWSMCSIDTGHASTHAPHVTQSQIDCSGTPLPTIGSVLCANTWSRMPMIRSFGERILPVAYAGHASWQRPHSVHEKPSMHLLLRQVEDRRGAEAQLRRPARRSAAARAARARACARATRSSPRSRCAGASSTAGSAGSRGRREMRPDEDALRMAVAGNALRAAPRAGRRDRSARRDARRVPAEQRQRRRPRSCARMTSASPRCEPWNRAGRTTLRMTTAVDDADEHEHDEEVDHPAEPRLAAEPRQLACLSTAAIIAITIVGKRTRKPQKMNACISPGTRRCRSFRWPSTISTSFCTRRGHVGRPVVRLRPAYLLREEPRSPREQRRRRRRATSSAEDDGAYEPRTFRSSALIAGTISCRSPITA